MMKRIIYIVVLCCYALGVQASLPSTSDSLQKLLPTVPHDSTRLELIKNILRIEQSNPQCIQFSTMLLKEATKQKNARYAGTAIYFEIVYYYNQNELDSVSKRLPIMERYARKANLWDFYFDSMRCEIDLYTYREQFELAVNKSIEMNDKAVKKKNIRGEIGAKQCLANAYMGSRQMQESKRTLEEAHQLLPKIENISVRNSVLLQLVSLSNWMENYADQLKYLNEQRLVLHSFIAANPAMKKAFANPLLFNEIYYAYYYIAMKEPQKALEHLTAANKYLSENSFFMYKALYDDVYASYYRLLKDYDNALIRMDSNIVTLKNALSSDYIHQMGIKADILTEAGRFQEAIPIYQQVLLAKDSLENDISNKQMELIQADYHIDKLLLEKGQMRNRIQLIALAVVLLVVVALSFFTMHLFRIRKALKLSEQQTRESTQIAEQANEVKNRFLSNMSYNIRIPLNGVVGFSQLIASEPNMDEKARMEYSAIIQKNSEELMRLVNDVLDLSRLEANMMKFQIQEYDAVSLSSDTIYMARMHNEGQHIEVQFDNRIEEMLPIQVDTARLTQALLSTLTYPQKSGQQRTVHFILSADDTSKEVRFCINNSPLADPKYLSQEVSIRHEINRLLLEHFGGTYTVTTHAPEGPCIVFTYPFTIKATVSE